jgi:hypothetical protein
VLASHQASNTSTTQDNFLPPFIEPSVLFKPHANLAICVLTKVLKVDRAAAAQSKEMLIAVLRPVLDVRIGHTRWLHLDVNYFDHGHTEAPMYELPAASWAGQSSHAPPMDTTSAHASSEADLAIDCCCHGCTSCATRQQVGLVTHDVLA